MTEYLVTWQIDIEADSPFEAAEQAREIQLNKDSEATCFIIERSARPSDKWTVDLLDQENPVLERDAYEPPAYN